MTRPLALLPILLVTSCGSSEALVVVTVGSPLGTLSVSTLDCTATSGTATSTFRVGGEPFVVPPRKTFGIAVPSTYSGRFDVSVEARDESGTLIGSGAGFAILHAGFRADITIDLKPTAAATCGNAGANLLCDDFESGSISMIRWQTYTTMNATVAVSPDQHHRGSYALHAQTPTVAANFGASAALTSAQTQLLPPTGFYIRAWIRLGADAPNANFVSAIGLLPNLIRIQNVAGKLNLHGSGTVPFDNASTFTLPLDEWHCVEWSLHQDVAPNSGEARVWVDRNELTDLHAVSLPHATLGVLAVGVGIDLANASPPTDVWIDDVLVDTKPIGCDR